MSKGPPCPSTPSHPQVLQPAAGCLSLFAAKEAAPLELRLGRASGQSLPPLGKQAM